MICILQITQFIIKKEGEMQATRNKPRCKQNCSQHIFQLNNNNGNTKLDVRIGFCPKFRRDPHPPQKTIPEYNLDNKYFTHAFVLGTQKKNVANNSHHEQVHFQTMIKDACQKNNQLVFPRPKQNNSFCSVCKQHFKNYYEHIRTQQHRIKIDAAIYNTEIKKLCDIFKSKWTGAHEKADQLLSQLVRSSQMYDKSLKQNNQEEQEQEQMQEDKNQISHEDNNEEGLQHQSNQQKNQDQERQQQLENQQEEDDKGQEIDDQNRQGRQIEQENEQKISQQDNNKNKENMRQRQRQSTIKNGQKQNDPSLQNKKSNTSIDNGGQNSKRTKIASSIKNEKHMHQNNNSNSSSNISPFFNKKSQLVIYLHKNTNGKYQVVRDFDKLTKSNLTTMHPQQLFQKQKNKDRLPSKAEQKYTYNLRGERERHNYKQYRQQKFNLKYDQRKRTKEHRQKQAQFNLMLNSKKQGKQYRNIYKIKNPNKEMSSQNRDNSSQFKCNQQEGLCQVLKNQVTRDRVKTRKERKQEDQLYQLVNKQKSKQSRALNKDKDISKQKSDLKNQKIKNKHQQMNKQKNNKNAIDNNQRLGNANMQSMGQNPMNFPIYGHAPPQNFMNMQKNAQGVNKNNMVGQKIPMMPPYHPIYMHGQQNQMGAKPGANQASGNFMPRPHMMINHPQFFNSQMMNYGMPHPPPPSVAQGSSVSGNTDEKPNDNRPYQPAMYYSQWNPYMMSANPMMRNENGNNEQMNNVSRQTMVNPPVPYRLPPGPMMNLNGPKGMKPMPMNSTGVNNSNVGMNSNGGSNATPNQTNNPSVPGSINPNVGPNMNSNVGMFMPYSMDPRYSYMGYPYMPKKAEEPPRDPR